MRLMGLMPIYQKPNTSKAAKGHKIYPYLLRGLHVDRSNQVWCADIIYLPIKCGFLYLVAIMDWHTCKVLAWRVSNTLEAGFCVDALNEAIHKFGPPEVMNTDQGSQLTSFAWTDGILRISTLLNVNMHCWGSEWTAKAASLTISLSNGCGGRLSMNASTCMPGKPDQRPELASENGSSSTTTSARILLLATNHLLWPIGRELKQPTPISRCK